MALFGTFGEIKKASWALQALATSAQALASRSSGNLEGQLAVTSLGERLDALEVKMVVWEAKVEAEMIRADSKFKAARNAEERERSLRKSNGVGEGDLEGEEEMREAYEALGLLPQGDVEAGNVEELPEVRAVVESHANSARALVRAYKFGA